jgi:hypothetical protein
MLLTVTVTVSPNGQRCTTLLTAVRYRQWQTLDFVVDVDSDYRFLSEDMSCAEGPVCRAGVSKLLTRHTRQLRCNSAGTC